MPSSLVKLFVQPPEGEKVAVEMPTDAFVAEVRAHLKDTGALPRYPAELRKSGKLLKDDQKFFPFLRQLIMQKVVGATLSDSDQFGSERPSV